MKLSFWSHPSKCTVHITVTARRFLSPFRRGNGAALIEGLLFYEATLCFVLSFRKSSKSWTHGSSHANQPSGTTLSRFCLSCSHILLLLVVELTLRKLLGVNAKPIRRGPGLDRRYRLWCKRVNHGRQEFLARTLWISTSIIIIQSVCSLFRRRVSARCSFQLKS